MTMRQKLDEFLDDTLGSAERAEIIAALRSDPAVVALLKRMQRERAHRILALASYEPSADEAAGLADDVLSACHALADAPVGRIHGQTGAWEWTRRLIGVAAAIGIAALAFAAGRSTSPPRVVKEYVQGEKEFNLVVLPVDPTQRLQPEKYRFRTPDELANKLMELDQQAQPRTWSPPVRSPSQM